MSVDIDVTEKQLKRAQAALGHIPGAAEPAITRAINRAISAANVEATRQIQVKYTLKGKKTVNAAKRITRRATKRSLSAVIEAKGSPIPLGAFITNPKKPPKRRPKKKLFAQVKQGEGGQVRSAFITTVQTGHIGIRHAGVFVRTKGNASLPIKQLYGPSVPQMIGDEEIKDYLERHAKAVLDDRLEHEINVILKGVVR